MKKIITGCALFLLAGCAGTPDDEVQTAAEMYKEATELYNAAYYDEGDEKLRELTATYPTSPYGQQGILDQLYSYSERRDYLKAIDTADRFIDLYPNHPQLPYVLYMKGVIYFREDRGLLQQLSNQDPASRDPKLMRLSLEAFRELLDSYPDSKYIADATARMRYLINNMAKHEMYIANFYYEHAAYLAAIGRARKVLLQFPDSAATEQALALLVSAYQKIGYEEGAADAEAMLRLNFPDNELLINATPE